MSSSDRDWLNILYVYQADKSPNTNFCYQAKFFICLYTYYQGHFWPKKLLIYCWTLKLIILVFYLWIRCFKGNMGLNYLPSPAIIQQFFWPIMTLIICVQTYKKFGLVAKIGVGTFVCLIYIQNVKKDINFTNFT